MGACCSADQKPDTQNVEIRNEDNKDNNIDFNQEDLGNDHQKKQNLNSANPNSDQ